MALLSVDSVLFDLDHEGLYLGTANPPETGKPKMAELGTPALSSLPVKVQTRHFPQLILCDVFGCLSWLVLSSQMEMEFVLAGICWAWLLSGGKAVQNGATFATLASKDVLLMHD